MCCLFPVPSFCHLGNELVSSLRLFSTLSKDHKVKAPPMVYISGEEMTHYVSQLVVQDWIKPYFDISEWETYDLSCKSRDVTNDQVLKDAVEAGKRIGAIFKEPTITPSALQVLFYISWEPRAL
jgi:isocitrate dehydrogenase